MIYIAIILIIYFINIDVLRKQELEMMNMALKEQLVETQERLRQMGTVEVQEREKVSQEKEEPLLKINSLESQLSYSNVESQKVFQTKTEITAVLNSSKGESIILGNNV